MATISLRIPDDLLSEVSRHAREMNIPRAEYMRQSMMIMNNKVELKMRRQRMIEASLRVREESMRINAEFDAVENTEA